MKKSFFFQDAFDPGHLMSNSPDSEQRMRNSLEIECEGAKNDPNPCHVYERTGSHGRFYRVNLSVIKDDRVHPGLGVRFPEQEQDFASSF